MSHFDCSRCTVPHEHDHLSGETIRKISISMLCFASFGIYWYHPQVLHKRCNDIEKFLYLAIFMRHHRLQEEQLHLFVLEKTLRSPRGMKQYVLESLSVLYTL